MVETVGDRAAITELARALRARRVRRLVCRFDTELLVSAPKLLWLLQDELWRQAQPDESEIELFLSLEQSGPLEREEVSGLRASADALIYFQATDEGRRVLSDLPVIYVDRSLRLVCESRIREREANATQLPDRFLRKRFAVVRSTRETARIFGLLTVNLSLPFCLEAVTRVQELLQRNERNVYCLHMTSLTPEKLANFAEIDVFVLFCDLGYFRAIASCLDAYWKPIITPYETCIMCSIADEAALASACTDPARYTFNLEVIAGWSLPSSSSSSSSSSSAAGAHQHDPHSNEQISDCAAVGTLRDSAVLSVNEAHGSDFAGGRLQRRGWRGLEPAAATAISHRALPGRAGRASAYDDERQRIERQASGERSAQGLSDHIESQ